MSSESTNQPHKADQTFFRRALPVVAVVAFVLMLTGVMVQIVDTLLILFGAILLALALRKLGNVIAERFGVSEFYGFLIGSLLILVVTAATIALAGPSMMREIQEAGPKLAESIQKITESTKNLEWFETVKQRLEEANMSPMSLLSSGVVPEFLGNSFSSSFGMLLSLALIFIVGFWLAWSPCLYREILLKLAPLSIRDRLREVVNETGVVLTNWVIGRIVAMLTVGVLTATALFFLGVPIPITLGILAGLISFVPTLGAFLAILPALLFALPQGGGQIVAVLVCYGVIQFLESNVITPLVMQQAVAVPPAFVLLLQLAMGMLIGGLGVAFAVPLAAAGSVFVKRLYIEGVLGDPKPDQVEPLGES